ncbi:MAG: PIG-L family deacetylase [Verrucomicrobia bacterium]|nr:PIG-L family deacetylase [Verrucomicrobiota bacterium]
MITPGSLWTRCLLGGASFCLAQAVVAADLPAPAPGAVWRQELRSFATTGTLLHIAAHPDDENTQLITYFARSRGYRTAYLSLTRGDGGQNEIGPEFDEKLGVARTQELLAARRIDGGRQFFTRAIDFGYSKTADETLRFWDRKEVLGDVVRVIRTFRPDVVVTRFSPTGGGTHGHHTASGILGAEAFKLAGDPQAYPEQLRQGLTVWQPKRVVLNSGGFGRGGGGSGSGLKVDIGGTDPVTGEGLGAIAGRSRGRHITQGFGSFGARGGGSGPNEQTFLPLGGEPATKDLFDGVETTWARYGAAGVELARQVEAAIAAFEVTNPAASVPALLEIRQRLAGLPEDPLVIDKREQLDRIVLGCLGVSVRSTAARGEIVPGERLEAALAVRVAGPRSVRLAGIRAFGGGRVEGGREIAAGQELVLPYSSEVPRDQPVSQPYWLRADGSSGIARVDDPTLIGRPENPPAFPVTYEFEIGGQRVLARDEVFAVEKGEKGERRQRVEVVPPVVLNLPAEVVLFAAGSSRRVEVEVIAARADVAGVARLALPDGWRCSPESQTFRLGPTGEKLRLAFTVTAPPQAARAVMAAGVTVEGSAYSSRRVVIDYAHLPRILLQPPARARLVVLDVATKGTKVGYLPGAGDDTVRALEQLGYEVRTLAGADLKPEKLAGLKAVVIGVRAFNERDDLAANLPGLFAWVQAGGTAIAQYNRPNGLAATELGPYKLSIQGSAPQWRVTDERAPVRFLLPQHPMLTTPNRIGPEDFAGWVQERGAYFPSSWDEERYEAVLAMSDPGEEPLRGGVLVARHGRGHYVYTGLAFFRQLPAGVPGAYRLLANLVSLGE